MSTSISLQNPAINSTKAVLNGCYCENMGLFDDEDFQTLFDANAYKQSLEKIAKGDSGISLPTVNDIDTTTIAIVDIESTSKPVVGSEQAVLGSYKDPYRQLKLTLPPTEKLCGKILIDVPPEFEKTVFASSV